MSQKLRVAFLVGWIAGMFTTWLLHAITNEIDVKLFTYWYDREMRGKP